MKVTLYLIPYIPLPFFGVWGITAWLNSGLNYVSGDSQGCNFFLSSKPLSLIYSENLVH